MFNSLKKFQDIIAKTDVLKYEMEENQIRIHIKLELKDSSQLIIRDYKFIDNTRKYVFHWMDKDGNLRIRWDNTAHWKDVGTFPHHKHILNDKHVADSTETDIDSVLAYIKDFLRRGKQK